VCLPHFALKKKASKVRTPYAPKTITRQWEELFAKRDAERDTDLLVVCAGEIAPRNTKISEHIVNESGLRTHVGVFPR